MWNSSTSCKEKPQVLLLLEAAQKTAAAQSGFGLHFDNKRKQESWKKNRMTALPLSVACLFPRPLLHVRHIPQLMGSAGWPELEDGRSSSSNFNNTDDFALL